MIKTKNLTKKYKDKLAVDHISFEVQTGKVTGFLGPNGAGKSTTMRLMLGLDNGQGETTYDGKKLQDHNQPSKVVGILLEAKAFHPTRTARDHLRILAVAGGITDKRVDAVLDIVGLKDVAHKKPGKFSLGMSQRLGIAAAILGHPKYLLLDEPANGLDPEGIVWLRMFIKDYTNQGNGVFVSSHLLSEMSQMADNIIVIGRGKLIASKPANELLAGGAHGGVYVRTTKVAMLERLLRQEKADFERLQGGLIVKNMKTDQIGKMAFTAGIPILELGKQTVSLEEIFLHLTADSQEYHGNMQKDDEA